MKIRLTALLAVSLLLSAGCADPEVDYSAPAQHAPEIGQPAPEAGSFRVVGYFAGRGDPQTGEFEIWMVDAEEAMADSDGSFGTIEQSLFCAEDSVSDGDPDTGPVGSLQLYSLPGETVTDAASARAIAPPGTVADGLAPPFDWFDLLNVFATNVEIRSFKTRPTGAIWAELTDFVGGVDQGLIPQDLAGVGETESPVGNNAPDHTTGLIWYGQLAADGNSHSRRTVQWPFASVGGEPFTFQGVLKETVPEICGNFVAENCNPTPDLGCFQFPNGEDCMTDWDCISAFCSSGVCADLTCPSTPDGECSGTTHGQCEAVDGTPECDCRLGVHGTACEYTCVDGIQNGDETQTDCGGSCPMRGEVCNGRDDDCDGEVDENGVCDEAVTTCDGTGFLIVETTATWPNSRTACRDVEGYDLAVVDGEWPCIAAGLAAELTQEVWIGKNDSDTNDSWVWSATTLEEPNATEWDTGEPGTFGTWTGECVTADNTTGLWTAEGCTNLHYALCGSVKPLTSGVYSDTDSDDIPDSVDHCINDPLNDFDGDGICADEDNCPQMFDPDEEDRDNDGIGDLCDTCPDEDVHTCSDIVDNVCPCNCDVTNDVDCRAAGSPQLCGNNILEGTELCDGEGLDKCPRDEPDCDDLDACTRDFVWHTDEPNSQDERLICSNSCINFAPANYGVLGCSCSTDLADRNDCRDGFLCETGTCVLDTDLDGIKDSVDNCPFAANSAQTDFDGDLLGNACDPDQDDDLVPNELDLSVRCADPQRYNGASCVNWTAASHEDTTWDNTTAISGDPSAMALGDFDGDGDDDVAVVFNHPSVGTDSQLEVFLRDNVGDGYTAQALVTFTGRDATNIQSYDVDGVTDDDLVIGFKDNDGTWILALNDGDGDFSGGITNYLSDATEPCRDSGDGSGGATTGIAVGDIDDDANTDLVITSMGGADFFEVWEWNGADFVCEYFDIPPVGDLDEFSSVAIVDMDGTGYQEIIFGTEYGIASFEFSTIWTAGTMYHCDNSPIWLTGPVWEYDFCPADSGRSWIQSGDWDDDGNMDVAMLWEEGDNPLFVYFGAGDGTISVRPRFAGQQATRHVWPDPVGLIAGDWWADATADLWVIGSGNDMLVQHYHKRTQQNLNTILEHSPGDNPVAGVYSAVDDRLIVANDGTNQISWRDSTDNRVNEIVMGVKIGDQFAVFDATGDGHLDVLLPDARDNPKTVRFFVNRADGSGVMDSFDQATGGAGTAWLGIDSSTGLSPADLNQDGDIDLVFSDSDEGSGVYWVQNMGVYPWFSSPDLVLIGDSGTPSSTLTVDLNADGAVDIVTATTEGDLVYWLTTVTRGIVTFSAPTTLSAYSAESQISASDLDDDGDVDLVAASPGNDTIYVYTNDGSAVFSSSSFPQTGGPSFLAIADLGEDGDGDLVVALSTNSQIAVLDNDGANNFTATTYATPASPTLPSIVDFTGDGNLDIVVGNETTKSIRLFTNDGSEDFSSSSDVTTISESLEVRVADMNNDGRVDLIYEMDYDHGGVADAAILQGTP